MRKIVPAAVASIPPPIVWNEEGRPFGVRLVREGDRYGRDDCLIHGAVDDPLVEFYDRSQDPARFGERGQFVSRYYIRTLREGSRSRGLCLDGGVLAWTLDASAMVQIHRWLDMVCPA